MFFQSSAIAAFALWTLGLTEATANPVQKRSINKGATFRIMPFGGSITVGKGSTQLNGYRRDLRNRLVNGGNKVEFVGTKSGGTMGGKFEAVSGYTIAHMDSTALNDGAYKSLPNVILIHLGTNDCNLAGKDPAGAPARYTTLLNNIKKHVPNALVVASSVIHNRKTSVDACIVTLNAGLKKAAEKAKAGGQKVIWLDMYPVVPKSDINFADETHPNDAGYALMAKAWYDSLVQHQGLISAPKSTTTSKRATSTPKKAAGTTAATSTSKKTTTTSKESTTEAAPVATAPPDFYSEQPPVVLKEAGAYE